MNSCVEGNSTISPISSDTLEKVFWVNYEKLCNSRSVSSLAKYHPQSLAEPGVILSAYPTPIVQPKDAPLIHTQRVNNSEFF